MAIGAAGTALPSSGIGFIGGGYGPANSPGSIGRSIPNAPPAAGVIAPNAGALAPSAMPAPNAAQAGGLFGIMPQQPQPQQAAPNMAAGGVGGLASLFGQMNPQHAAAIRGIPQEAMMALHRAGMIHPDLMRHLYGGAQF